MYSEMIARENRLPSTKARPEREMEMQVRWIQKQSKITSRTKDIWEVGHFSLHSLTSSMNPDLIAVGSVD